MTTIHYLETILNDAETEIELECYSQAGNPDLFNFGSRNIISQYLGIPFQFWLDLEIWDALRSDLKDIPFGMAKIHHLVRWSPRIFFWHFQKDATEKLKAA